MAWLSNHYVSSFTALMESGNILLLLYKYVSQKNEHYIFILPGIEKQTMNLHLLRHLPQCVKSYGPLFHFSCFGFESMNSHLKSMFHGTRHVNNQVGIFTLYIFCHDQQNIRFL